MTTPGPRSSRTAGRGRLSSGETAAVAGAELRRVRTAPGPKCADALRAREGGLSSGAPGVFELAQRLASASSSSCGDAGGEEPMVRSASSRRSRTAARNRREEDRPYRRAAGPGRTAAAWAKNTGAVETRSLTRDARRGFHAIDTIATRIQRSSELDEAEIIPARGLVPPPPPPPPPPSPPPPFGQHHDRALCR